MLPGPPSNGIGPEKLAEARTQLASLVEEAFRVLDALKPSEQSRHQLQAFVEARHHITGILSSLEDDARRLLSVDEERPHLGMGRGRPLRPAHSQSTGPGLSSGEAPPAPNAKVQLTAFGAGWGATAELFQNLTGIRKAGPYDSDAGSVSDDDEDPTLPRVPTPPPKPPLRKIRDWLGGIQPETDPELFPALPLDDLGFPLNPILFTSGETHSCYVQSADSPLELALIHKQHLGRRDWLRAELARAPPEGPLPAFSDDDPFQHRRFPLVVPGEPGSSWHRAEVIQKVVGAEFVFVRLVDEGASKVVGLRDVRPVPRQLMDEPRLSCLLSLCDISGAALTRPEVIEFRRLYAVPGQEMLVEGSRGVGLQGRQVVDMKNGETMSPLRRPWQHHRRPRHWERAHKRPATQSLPLWLLEERRSAEAKHAAALRNTAASS